MPEIHFYLWPHRKPPGTCELVYSERPQVADELEALRVLDTAYDRTRHRYVVRLCEEDGSAAFCVKADGRSASFQVAVKGLRSYPRVVDELNAQWLRSRSMLAAALVS